MVLLAQCKNTIPCQAKDVQFKTRLASLTFSKFMHQFVFEIYHYFYFKGKFSRQTCANLKRNSMVSEVPNPRARVGAQALTLRAVGKRKMILYGTPLIDLSLRLAVHQVVIFVGSNETGVLLLVVHGMQVACAMQLLSLYRR